MNPKVDAASCCPRLDGDDCQNIPIIVCCSPCLYGNALTQANAPDDKHPDPNLCPTNTNEWLVLAGTCLFGRIVPCLVGVYIRQCSNAAPNDKNLLKSILAECCPILSCAPCQIEAYRQSFSPDLGQVHLNY